ncbi:diguanylate cyclase [Roseateles saccharophilus]|uniref:Diguanylate cyclase n=1 Tax=Roseateles saccharophilus TaxID=304 RepID=A0A4R3UXJ7_ROSSA|nr:diguanylate cyclase [Roseateles saccharophilus]MDG0832678.1 diguanylate cyclase [Roseateles saccharophilus]TCU95388.1 diguanylate cyclase [Roseateles saccharophilus]
MPKKLARRIWLNWAVGIALLLALVEGMVGMALYASYQEHTARARQSVESLAQTLGQSVSADIRLIDNSLASLDRELVRAGPDVLQRPERLREVVDSHRDLVPELFAIRVTDAQGRVLNRETEGAMSVEDRPYFQAARQRPNRLVVSDPVVGRVSKDWTLVFARARIDAAGRFDGIVYASMPTHHYFRMLNEVEVGTHGAATLRTESLSVVARYAPPVADPNAGTGTSQVSEDLRAWLARNPDQGFFTTRTALDGIERVSAYVRVPGYRLLMLVGLDTDSFYAPWRAEVAQLLGLSILLVVVVVATSLALGRRQIELRQAQMETSRLLAEQSVMLDNDLIGIAKTRDRVTVWHNRALATMFGYGPSELVGQPSRLLYPDEASYARIGRAYAELDTGRPFRTELQMRHRDGRLIWIDLSGIQLGDGVSMWVMVDISRVKANEANAERRAGLDLLTGLPNRLGLDAALPAAIRRARLADRALAVVFIDLDGFKAVNDTHGHDAGDALLREMARRIADGIRGEDLAARIGGDEFVVVLSEVSERADVLTVLERMLGALSLPAKLPDGSEAGISASMGVALWPEHAADAAGLLTLADQAMYAAKRAGKGRIVFGTEG